MTDQVSSFIDRLTEIRTPPFTLQDLEGFPWNEYSERISVYEEAENWYSGAILDTTKTRSGQEVEQYPVKINPIKAGVQKHTFALFGEVEEDDSPLVDPKVVFTDDTQKKLAEEAEEVLSQIWWESNGRAVQWKNAAISQVYGGCVFKASFDPYDALRSIKLRIESIHPKYFVGRPDAGDMFRLREAWIVKPISQEEALELGYTGGFTDEFEVPYHTEHWTLRTFRTWVQNQPLTRQTTDGESIPLSGANPYGFVPLVYIPHIRVDGFYGENFFDSVKGIIRELNLRVADFGDAVTADAHAYMGMRNVQGSADIITLAPGVNAIDLGSTMSMTGNESAPDLWDLRKARASESMATLVDWLYNQYRRDAFVPKVADGEDEGSQRSGLTLAMRMLSLLWHIQNERVFWTTGLNLFNRMLLHMCFIKDQLRETTGIGQSHTALRIRQDWSPVLPRDREMLVNEVVARMGAKLGSPQTLLDILGDIQDPDEEIKRIIEFAEEIAEAETVQQPQPTRQNVSAGTPSSGAKSSE